MKFPRNARIYRGHLDAAPYASVFFLLVIFVLLGSMTYTPGVRVQLPAVSQELPGTDRPTISVALGAGGQIYFKNQLVEDEQQFQSQLRDAAAKAKEPLTLIVQADKTATEEHLIRLATLARSAGINEMLFATLPRAIAPTGSPKP